MKATKQRIIQSAIELFNEKGLTNVRLQHIADKSGISVGNLAYHFYGKEAIVNAVDEQLSEWIRPVLYDKWFSPNLIDFDNQLSSYFFLLKSYSFYFLDLLELERGYPEIHIKRKAYIQQMIGQINHWMELNVAKGILKPEIQDSQYQNTTLTIWMIITFWLTQQQVRGLNSEDEGRFKEVVWNQCLPLFTEIGMMEYEAIILPQLKYYSV